MSRSSLRVREPFRRVKHPSIDDYRRAIAGAEAWLAKIAERRVAVLAIEPTTPDETKRRERFLAEIKTAHDRTEASLARYRGELARLTDEKAEKTKATRVGRLTRAASKRQRKAARRRDEKYRTPINEATA